MGINNPNVRRASDPPPIFAVGRTRSAILAAKLRLLKSACGVYTLFTLKRSNDGEAELQTDDAKDAERREGGTSAVLSNGPFPIASNVDLRNTMCSGAVSSNSSMDTDAWNSVGILVQRSTPLSWTPSQVKLPGQDHDSPFQLAPD
ncbi:hypothetical protein BDP67DRAFT_491335 [Colletotrichum lupini]|nr:hypothetical protein BDP67DRAFT_491335 [Colletotrichum lupini]